MKILIPILATTLTFSLSAQEPVEVKPPVKPTPPVKVTPPAKTTPPVKVTPPVKIAPRVKVAPPAKPGIKAPSASPRPPVGRPPTSSKSAQNGAAALRAAAAKSVPQSSKTSQTRRRVVLPPKSTATSRPAQATAHRVPARAIQAAKLSASKELTENITIRLQGSVSDGPPLDLSLTGIGPIFQADVVAGDKFTILSHQYSVKPAGSGYKVEYSIGLRIRMEMAQTGNSVSYEFRDVSVTGTVMVKEGERVVISKNGDRELALTLSKASKK